MSSLRPKSIPESTARTQMVEICRRLYDKGLIAAGDGNVSMKLDDERVLVTPSGFHKGFIQPDDLIITDLHGKRLKGRHNPSSEFLMHELCYADRSDVRAVVHAHPPLTVALALAGISLAQCVLSETCLLLGPILTAPYSTPTTEEVPRLLRPYLRQANAIVLDRHGALTVGRTLDEAWHRMEAMEHAAKITQAAHAVGPVTPLGAPEVAKLQTLATRLGIPRAPDPCTLCNACPSGSGGPQPHVPRPSSSPPPNSAPSATSLSAAAEQSILDAVLARLRT